MHVKVALAHWGLLSEDWLKQEIHLPGIFRFRDFYMIES